MTTSDKDQKLINTLKEKFGFWESTAIAFIEAKGRCVYCDEDLYSTRLRYSSLNIDHLFPQSTFPQLKNVQSNLVLSCFRCNNLKRGEVFSPEVNDPQKMLEDDRKQVIDIVRKKLSGKINEDIENCKALNEILQWNQTE